MSLMPVILAGYWTLIAGVLGLGLLTAVALTVVAVIAFGHWLNRVLA